MSNLLKLVLLLGLGLSLEHPHNIRSVGQRYSLLEQNISERNHSNI